VLAAPDHAELHHARDLLAEAHAARAVDTTRHVGCNQRAQVLVHYHALGLLVARAARPVAHRQILQLALAALVANWAVKRMIYKKKFHNAALRIDGLRGVGMHLHAVGNGRRARRQRLRRFLNLHQAHAAVGGNRELAVVAEVRNVHAGLVYGVHDRRAVRDLHRLAVDFDL